MFRAVWIFGALCCAPVLASPAHVRLDVDLAHPTLKADQERPATKYLKVEVPGTAVFQRTSSSQCCPGHR